MDPALQAQSLTLLEQHRAMSLATLRPDGRPQATPVGFAHGGLRRCFSCDPDSQKAANLARDDRVSLTLEQDPPQMRALTGLSMAARAQRVVDRNELDRAQQLRLHRYSEPHSIPGLMPRADARCIFRVTPEILSVLYYSKGIAPARLVRCEPSPDS